MQSNLSVAGAHEKPHLNVPHRSSATKVINKCGTTVERGFNVAGCIPFVGFISGSLRFIAGKVQFVAGLILMVVGYVGHLCSKNPKSQETFKRLLRLGQEQTVHGALNMIRGFGEAFMCSAFFGVGNLVFLIPNLAKDDKFSPFFKYGTWAK